MRSVVKVCIGLCFLSSTLLMNVVRAEVVSKLQINNQGGRINDQTVSAYLGIEVGDDTNQAAIDRGLRRLYKTGFFKDISVTMKAGVLQVDLEESAVIASIKFEGNTSIKSQMLKEAVELKVGDVYADQALQKTVRLLNMYYYGAGRYNVRITPEIEYLEQNRVAIYFSILEGDKVSLASISYIGNEKITDAQLSTNSELREKYLINLLSPKTTFSLYRLTSEENNITRLYRSKGYLDAVVKSSFGYLSADYTKAYVVFDIKEGEQYTIGNIDIETSLPDLDLHSLWKRVDLSVGDPYHKEHLMAIQRYLLEDLHRKGYPFGLVEIKEDKFDIATDQPGVDVLFFIKDGPPVYVESIQIIGNHKVRDYVLRSMIPVQEGDPLNQALLYDARVNLISKSYIDDVNIQKVPGSKKGLIKLIFKIKEKGSSGSLFFTGGYSSLEKLILRAMYNESNLIGTGINLRMSARGTSSKVNYDVALTFPDIMYDPHKYVTLLMFSSESALNINKAYRKISLGSGIEYGQSLMKNLRQSISLTVSAIEVRRSTSGVGGASSIWNNVLEKRVGVKKYKQVLTNTLKYQRNPVRYGEKWSLGASHEISLVSPRAKDANLSNKVSVDLKYLLPMGMQFISKIRAGWLRQLKEGAQVPIDAGYILGGSGSFPGFAYGGVGPRIKSAHNKSEVVGADTFYTVRGEVRKDMSPAGTDVSLYLFGFGQVGAAYLLNSQVPSANLFNSKLVRVTAGVGVLWYSPFGPMNISWSKPITYDRDYDVVEELQFGIGG